jgi:hypothetical protein
MDPKAPKFAEKTKQKENNFVTVFSVKRVLCPFVY